MNKLKSKQKGVLILALLLVVFTVIAFALPFKKNALFWVSYIFGVLAILTQVYVLRSAFGGKEVRSRFYGFPVAKVGFIALVMQLVLSFLFMALSAICPLWIAIVAFLLLFCLMGIGLLSTEMVRDEITRQDKNAIDDTSCMNTLRSIVYPLADQCKDQETKKALRGLADAFRYSDPVSDPSFKTIEEELEAGVAELQKQVAYGDKIRITEACKTVSSLLTERNRLCKLNKSQK